MGGPLVERALHHVAFLFLLCLASTFPWWAAANLARAEYRRLLSALACSMRVFCYSICILCILVALLSLNLAILNILPIPVLDGGYLMYLAIEKIKGSPVSGRMLGYSQMLGMAFVLALLLFVTYNDIMRLL